MYLNFVKFCLQLQDVDDTLDCLVDWVTRENCLELVIVQENFVE